MQGQSLARFIIGIIGNIISALLFVAPVPTMWRIWKKKSTEEFHPYPYLASTMNCMLWVFYGMPFVHPDSILVITINSFGLFIEILYLLIFMAYASNAKYRAVITIVFLAEVALLGVIAVITVLCFHTFEMRSMFVGIICVIFGIIMYASPLSIIAKVMKTQSAEFMPFWLSLACFMNGIVWFIYAFLKSIDPYIASGNGIGAVLSSIQLYIYVYYTVKAKRSGRVESDAKHGETA
ncbi:bidirectional sugar transporter SWEET5-like [Salvia miltiorrhiza]|uniref:bidirectional sugar transporter SWEET5-like n=1 Tax=Salvia miltiorrhiza TaxID=226208 RepID=UPI0025AB6053|nr:bidirectional sugar transporter SWEET5-like [Salvia miltiorrhiza]